MNRTFTLTHMLAAAAICLLIGMVISLMIRPHKIVYSELIDPIVTNFGDCKMSTYEIEVQVTINDYAPDFVPRDTLCPENRDANFAIYGTAEGIGIDMFAQDTLIRGDVIKVKGRFYIASDRYLVIHTGSWTPINVHERISPILTYTPTPQKVIIVTPTPER